MTASNITAPANVAQSLKIETNWWPSVSCPWLEMTSWLKLLSPQKRAHPRFLFVADAEITLRDGTSVPTQLDELSARGCYMGTLKPIPLGTEFRLRIWEGIRTCELEGTVLYLHSGNTLGIFGMGVLFGNMAVEQRSVIDAWQPV